MLDSILLEACAPEKNIWRSYRIAFGQDLFGSWIVELCYGRIGSRGRSKMIMVDNETQALDYVEKCLKKRQSAPKRIGASYTIKELPHDWIVPQDPSIVRNSSISGAISEACVSAKS